MQLQPLTKHLQMLSGFPKSDEDQICTGVLIGSGIGGIEGIVEAGYTLRDKGPRRISPFLFQDV